MSASIGDRVIVKTFSGKPKIGVIWDFDSSAVFICSEGSYQNYRSGASTPPEVGFPAEDVYIYDDSFDINDIDCWNKLTPISHA